MVESTSSRLSIEQAYREHWVPLVRLALLLTGSRERAEDVVQTVFASAHSRWESIEKQVPYLRRAVVNASADMHRRRHREPRIDREPVTALPDLDETWQHILRLPERRRAVVVLHFYEDLALVDIASLLDVPSSTVRSDLRRALAALKKELS
jgi:RNA polymerase sigma factor (sigma-70 family)